jgi:hypothetical protein
MVKMCYWYRDCYLLRLAYGVASFTSISMWVSGSLSGFCRRGQTRWLGTLWRASTSQRRVRTTICTHLTCGVWMVHHACTRYGVRIHTPGMTGLLFCHVSFVDGRSYYLTKPHEIPFWQLQTSSRRLQYEHSKVSEEMRRVRTQKHVHVL